MQSFLDKIIKIRRYLNNKFKNKFIFMIVHVFIYFIVLCIKIHTIFNHFNDKKLRNTSNV